MFKKLSWSRAIQHQIAEKSAEVRWQLVAMENWKKKKKIKSAAESMGTILKVILLSGGKSNRNTISATAELYLISMKMVKKNGIS